MPHTLEVVSNALPLPVDSIPMQGGESRRGLAEKIGGRFALLSAVAVSALGVAAIEAPEAEASLNGPAYFVDYNQNQIMNGHYKWGERIAHTGCGPTSLAMVVASETGRLATPHTITQEIPRKYYQPGAGTDPRAFPIVARLNGLSEKHVGRNFKAAERVLSVGGLAIVHALPGHFTGKGHYMVLKRYSHGRFTLADPNGHKGRDSERRRWTPGQLRANGTDNIWTFRTAMTH